MNITIFFCSRRYSSKESIVEAVKIGQGVYVHCISWMYSSLIITYIYVVHTGTTRGHEKDFGVRVRRAERHKHCIVLILIVTVMPFVFTWSSTVIPLRSVTWKQWRVGENRTVTFSFFLCVCLCSRFSLHWLTRTHTLQVWEHFRKHWWNEK